MTGTGVVSSLSSFSVYDLGLGAIEIRAADGPVAH